MITRARTGLPEPHPQMAPLISSYQDGLASPDEADLVERHLLECEVCRSFYGGLQEFRELIANLPFPPPGSKRIESAYEAVMNRTVRRAQPRWRPPKGKEMK